jgi:hypothetical protein
MFSFTQVFIAPTPSSQADVTGPTLAPAGAPGGLLIVLAVKIYSSRKLLELEHDLHCFSVQGNSRTCYLT